jgi:hypothetical protein
VTLTLNIPAEMEQRLREEAARAGLEPGEFARRVLSSHLGSTQAPVQSVSDLFRQWDEEDRPADAADLAAREAEFEAFKAGMNRNKIDSDGPAARIPYP